MNNYWNSFDCEIQSDELASLTNYEEQIKIWEREMIEDFDPD